MAVDSKPILAHVALSSVGEWRIQELSLHLQLTAEMASRWAAGFSSETWALMAGRLHDLGKAGEDFQRYIAGKSGYDASAHLEGQSGRVDHSSAGAIWAHCRWGSPGLLLGYLIAGHHAGLPDWHGGMAGLEARLGNVDRLQAVEASGICDSLVDLRPPNQRPSVDSAHPEDAHLWLRMLFSCLVDADFLDTEKFMDEARGSLRGKLDGTLGDLKIQLDTHMAHLGAGTENTPVNLVRRQVLEACRAQAAMAPGLFSLTVPTGGGKTLASMVFALDHALKHGKRRIIVVIPYTSIIEQTAEVLTGVFGPGKVLEHHSNLDPERETPQSRLASENWDAPIVVTTNVQFFESLFAAKTSACRKLHNLVDSVVIFDEAQMLPPQFLKPIVQVLGSLVRHYGISAVLCTATQPALQGRIGSQGAEFEGLEGVRELMPDPSALAVALRRTEVRLQSPNLEPIVWEDLAKELATLDQVLCIVNTRKDCRALHALMPEGTIHLSALMCPQHRSDVIKEIKEGLKRGWAMRVVSTQLVEAGVDLDFPVVYRALAGLDSMAQAAGRCNREGNRRTLGKVILFSPPTPAPPGLQRKGEDALKEMLRICPETLSLDPGSFNRYFKLYYAKVTSFDEKRMGDLLVKDAAQGHFQFREAAQAFRLIEDEDQQAIVVRYGLDHERLDRIVAELRFAGPSRERMRALQRFTVTLPSRVAKELQRQGDIEEVHGLWIQVVDGLYDDRTGLCLDRVRFTPGLCVL